MDPQPLELAIPLFVSHMSFGALSREAKVALATGAKAAGTAICSGEGGMHPDERAAAGTYVVAILMVTTFRYYSFKEIDFARRRPASVLVLVVLGVLIVASHPQWFLFLLFTAYVLSGPTRPLWARRREVLGLGEREPGEAHERERRA